MNNVVDINSKRRRSYATASIEQIQQEVQNVLTGTANGPDAEVAGHALMVDDLHSLADDAMLRKLKIIHDREATARNWTAQEADIAAELEAAAFLAYRAGVPEEAIYDIDYSPLSDALNRAISKVATA